MSTARLFVLTTARMREADGAAIAAGTPVATLMERAGAGAVRAMEQRFGRLHGYRVAVVAGKGNNGGDGFVVARLLAGRGARVTVHPVGPAEALVGPPRAAFDTLAGTAVRVAPAPAGDAGLALAPETDFVVDALLGTGSAGALAPAYARAVAAIAQARAAGARVVALDLPSGYDADTARPLARGDDGRVGGSGGSGAGVVADLTVAFAHLKPVHVLWPGRAACGAITIADIGVEPVGTAAGVGARAGAVPDAELATEPGIAALLPRRAPTAHKGACGRVLVVGGSVGLTGAVVMASNAALRAGAGLVTAGVPASLGDALEAAMVEPMKWPLPESPERALGAAAAPMVLARARDVQAVALGPGLSRAPEAAELARRLVAEAPVAIVLDADGLNAFAGRGAELARRPAGAALVVTPHPGEMERLSGLAPEALERERLTAPARFAAAWNAVVVLKGAPTVIAAPDGRTTVNPTGNPGMATAGMGDVLSGILAGLLAQGLDPYDAARVAVFVHGLAADVAHARVGTLALVAGDVTAALPQVLCRLEGAGTRSRIEPLPPDRLAPASSEPSRSA